MTLSELEAQLYRTLGYSATPPTEVVTRLRAFLNEVHREILGHRAMGRLRLATLSATSVAGSPRLVLPQRVGRILSVIDAAQYLALARAELSTLRLWDPGRASSSSRPTHFAVVDVAAPVAAQPSAPSQLQAVSTNGADTTQTVRVTLLRSGGYSETATATLTGTTPVSVGPGDTTAVIAWTLSAAPAGAVSLKAGSATLATIPPGQQTSRYAVLELWPLPSAAVTYSVEAELPIPTLANPEDTPLLPEDFHDLLILGAQARELTQPIRESRTVSAVEGRYARRLAELLMFLHHQAPAAQAGRRRGVSQLGPWFPAGS